MIPVDAFFKFNRVHPTDYNESYSLVGLTSMRQDEFDDVYGDEIEHPNNKKVNDGVGVGL